jgi:hypothetical protein
LKVKETSAKGPRHKKNRPRFFEFALLTIVKTNLEAKMHQYYYGGEQASLEAADVDAAWKSEPRALALLNKAFEIYYDACNSIKQVDDVEMRQKLALSLDKAAKYWYPLYSGFGKVNTLVGAFEHLDKNSGRWTDNNTGSYNGGVGGTGWV